MSDKLSLKPCPICQTMMWVVGNTAKGKKLTSCGHAFKFKQTKSQKDMSRKYIETPWGLELAPVETENTDVVKSNVTKA